MQYDIHGLVQDCGNSSALAMELPQSCAEPSTPVLGLLWHMGSMKAISICANSTVWIWDWRKTLLIA